MHVQQSTSYRAASNGVSVVSGLEEIIVSATNRCGPLKLRSVEIGSEDFRSSAARCTAHGVLIIHCGSDIHARNDDEVDRI